VSTSEIFKYALEKFGATKETTLIELLRGLLPNRHSKLVVDLSTARTDAVLITSAVGFKILSRSAGATFSLKLHIGSDYLTQADIADKEGIEVFAPSDLMMTNAAQVGLSVTILVLRRV